MIIRCPQCEHSRSIPESKIPPTAELATCPRCGSRFRFRVLDHAEKNPESEHRAPSSAAARSSAAIQAAREATTPTPSRTPRGPAARAEAPFPQPAPEREDRAMPPDAPGQRESARGVQEDAARNEGDLWDAVDALGKQWQTRLDGNSDAHAPSGGRAAPAAPESGRNDAPRNFQDDFPARAMPPAAPPEPRREARARRNGMQSSPPTRAGSPRRAQTQATLDIPPIREPETPGDPAQSRPGRPEEGPPARSPEQPARFETRREQRPAVFPYADDGPPPEERVEQHMRMLHDSEAASRPTRHLGTLREHTELLAEPLAESQVESPADSPVELPAEAPAGSPADSLAEAPAEAPADRPERIRVAPAVGENEDVPGASFVHESLADKIPWENSAYNGWGGGLFATIQGVMFRAPDFFSGLTGGGSLVPGYIFFLIMGYVAILSSLAWIHAASVLLPTGTVPLPDQRVMLPMLLLMAPFALGLMLLLVSCCLRIFVSLCAPGKSGFARIYKIVAYSFAPLSLSVVPIVGPIIGVLWFFLCLGLGCRHALDLPWNLAIPIALPPALLLIGGIAWYFL